LVADKYISKPELPLNIQRPEMNPETSFIDITILVLIITAIIIVLAKFKLFRLWKLWFLFSVWFTLVISFAAFSGEWVAVVLATVFALLKVYRPSVVVHNFTELFIYGALAAIFVSLISVTSAAILLLIISAYDYIAVRKTKHMVKLAKFQGKSSIFAGLMIPYKKRVAILGGGDIGFPLLFASAVMQSYGNSAFVVPLFSAAALFLLFYFGKDKKYYPAMPYLTAGCFAGFAFIKLVFGV